MTVKGIHHVSSITKEILDNHDFYTNILGLRLVKKTVNQDDTGMYHLFYADYKGTPGTDITFFEIFNAPKFQPGTNSISRTIFRVPSMEALEFFRNRFDEKRVYHEGFTERFGHMSMIFEDHEKQRMALMVDTEYDDSEPNSTDEIPKEYAITSIGAVEITVQYLKAALQLLELLGGEVQGDLTDENTGAEVKVGRDSVHVVEQRNSQLEKEGYGSVHHFSLRVADENHLQKMLGKLREEKWPNSGIVDRHYFKAVYIQAPGGITIELSTDGPGFTVDEPLDNLGENLSLPPKIEDQRDFIETYLTPFN
ncbi:MAG TPA: VOC family protein [Candidatus Salinicoccus stercoripullorum]|uniref:VOC family protein n=1 Tax=Candidatus Salinicoccus stercoripullorum TaxID=2838756 RepID=A0A9D1U1P7_9STAP|nr:VOC family protein [Candidatus Salinicoccus stercoripullorum]